MFPFSLFISLNNACCVLYPFLDPHKYCEILFSMKLDICLNISLSKILDMDVSTLIGLYFFFINISIFFVQGRHISLFQIVGKIMVQNRVIK